MGGLESSGAAPLPNWGPATIAGFYATLDIFRANVAQDEAHVSVGLVRKVGCVCERERGCEACRCGGSLGVGTSVETDWGCEGTWT